MNAPSDWSGVDVPAKRHPDELERRLAIMSIVLTIVVFGLGGAVVWWPSLDDPSVVPTVLAPVVLVGVLTSFVAMIRGVGLTATRALILITLALWAPLILADDRWSTTIVVVFLLAWSAGGRFGPVLAVLVTAVWVAAWLADGAPAWIVAIPISVLAGSAFISWAAGRIAADNRTKDELIARLESSRQQLAAAERERGALTERARFASEVHDTLAQGFTSIVLLSRIGKRTEPESTLLPQIEETALSNLDAARRLVENGRPVELENARLPDALRRQLHQVIGEDRSAMGITGTPCVHGGAVEVTAFRAVQEALLNISRHADATSVRLDIQYLDDEFAMRISDDGCGFTSGDVVAHEGVAGGQGLQAMRDRVASLGGMVDVDSTPGIGTTVSVRLPTGQHE